MPCLAVVIPCYNSEDWISRAIQSVLDQNYPNLLLIVIDDGSQDRSLDLIRNFKDMIVFETGSNRGACHARNRGTLIARNLGADFITYLDADDYLEGSLLNSAVAIAIDTLSDLVISDMDVIEDNGYRNSERYYEGTVDPRVFFRNWLLGRFINPASLLWRMPLIERLNGWDETLVRHQDMDFVLRAMFEEPVIVTNNRGGKSVYCRVNPKSISKDQSARSMSSRMRVLMKLMQMSRGTRFEELNAIMSQKLYRLSRDAFRVGYTDLGRMGLQELYSLNYRRHHGTIAHRIVCSMIGLEWKVRLSGG